MISLLIKYAHYNKWANELLLSVIEKEINDELLDRDIESSFPSLRKTVYHIWGAEYIWLRRLNNESLTDWPGKNFNGTFSEAKEKMLANDAAFIKYVETLNDEKLSELFTYKNIEGKTFTNPVSESVLHCLNHSTYHRGQIVTMIRQLGLTTIPSTDFISYCRIN